MLIDIDSDIVKSAFGEVVTKYRLEAGFRQRAFSREVGISNSHMRAIESGSVSPTLVTLFKVANALNVQPSVLVQEAYEIAVAQTPAADVEHTS